MGLWCFIAKSTEQQNSVQYIVFHLKTYKIAYKSFYLTEIMKQKQHASNKMCACFALNKLGLEGWL